MDANSLLLLLGLLCHILPLLFRYGGVEVAQFTAGSVAEMSTASSIVMLVAYAVYIVFQLKTHGQVSGSQEVDNNIKRKS